MHENSENSDFVLCKVDLKNAFNNVSRAAFIALTRHYFPELSRWVEWCYGTTSALTYGQIRISSEEGAQQGDPLGPLLFSLVMLQVSEEIKISSGGLQLHMWYLDDGVLAGPSYEVQNALRVIAEVGPKWGMFLNPEKCEIITHPASAMQTDIFYQIPREQKNFQGNFSILGSPIGSSEFCRTYLEEHAIDPAVDTLLAIQSLEDPQVALSTFTTSSEEMWHTFVSPQWT